MPDLNTPALSAGTFAVALACEVPLGQVLISVDTHDAEPDQARELP